MFLMLIAVGKKLAFLDVFFSFPSQDDEVISATQNLDLLLDAFVNDVTQVDAETSPKDDVWDEMCDFLTQKKAVERTHSTVSSEEVKMIILSQFSRKLKIKVARNLNC